MKIAMIGSGYVGLVSGVCFAEFGYSVVCVDRDPRIIERLNSGAVTIYEPDLEAMLGKSIAAGRLSFTGDMTDAVADADVIFIAVGTPSRRGDGAADLSFIMEAADEVADNLKSGQIVAIKSTVEVGTNAAVAARIRARRPGVDFSMVSNPEFLREGSAIEDFMRPDRVVVGVEDQRGRETMQKVYRPLYLRDTPMVITSLTNAELVKYASNAFLATKITFINQIADLCEKTGGDVQEVAKAMGMDGRIGNKFLHAGPGFGGSCFPKDIRALSEMGRRHGAIQQLAETVHRYNEERKSSMADRILALLKSAGGDTVAMLGVSFKPNTDDIRESPALAIIDRLLSEGVRVRANDPAAMEAAKTVVRGVTWLDSPYEAAQGADIVALATEWNAYRAIEMARLRDAMRGRDLIDMRNVYRPEDVANSGLAYHSIGRAPVRQ